MYRDFRNFFSIQSYSRWCTTAWTWITTKKIFNEVDDYKHCIWTEHAKLGKEKREREKKTIFVHIFFQSLRLPFQGWPAIYTTKTFVVCLSSFGLCKVIVFWISTKEEAKKGRFLTFGLLLLVIFLNFRERGRSTSPTTRVDVRPSCIAFSPACSLLIDLPRVCWLFGGLLLLLLSTING